MNSIPFEKWLVMAILTVLSIFFGLIPYLIVRHGKAVLKTESTKYKVILTILSCFGGGVLFATTMLHLIPELRESFEGIPSVWETFDEHFPLAESVAILGFVLIYLVEEIAHFILVDGHHDHVHNINNDINQMQSVVRHNSIAHSIPIPNIKDRGSFSLSSPRGSIITIQTLSQQRPSFCITIPEDSPPETGYGSSGETKNSLELAPNNANNNLNTVPTQMEANNVSTKSVSPSTKRERRRTLSHISASDIRISESMDTIEEEECPDDKTNFASSLRTFLALIALSFHAIMEGVTIGIQNSSSVWLLFGAVASHKFVISFCMGMELVASEAKILTHISSISFFSIVSPIGIVIGSLLASEDATEKSIPVTIVEGLACGTLLYVVFFEILNRERERKSYAMPNSKAIGFIQFVALLVGIVAMGCLLTFAHNHDHHDAEDGDGHHHPHLQLSQPQ